MTWPAPTSRPLPPPPSAGPRRPPDDRTGAARPVAAWLAATGGSLVLVAAIIVVAGNWQDLAAGIKLGGLIAIAGAVVIGAERARAAVPATARALAHLGAALGAPVGIAAAAAAGGTWPCCVVVGGALAAAACDVQARRWHAPLLDGATIIAVGLALTGAAALVPVPIGLLGALAGCAFLAARRETAAATFALAGAASPLLVALAEQRIGPGTLDRIGATGEVLAWSAPLAGVLAAVVLAVVATRRGATSLAAAAIAAPIVGVVTGLASRDTDELVWICLPGVVLIALETVAALAHTRPWDRLAPVCAGVVATAAGTAAIVVPGVVALSVYRFGSDVALLPLVVTAAGLSMTTLRSGRVVGDVATAGAASLTIAASVALGAPVLVAAAIAATLAAAAAVIRTGRLLPTLVPMSWAAAGIVTARLVDETWVSTAGIGLAAVLIGVALELRLRNFPARVWEPDLPAAAIALGGASLAAWCSDSGRPTLFVAVLAAAVVQLAVRRPIMAPALLVMTTAIAGLEALRIVGEADHAPLNTSFGLGLTAVSLAALSTWWRAGTAWASHLAAVAAVAAGTFALVAIGADSTEISIGLMIAAVVLTGWAYVTIDLTPIASAGITAGVVAIGAAQGSHPLLTSLAYAVVGIQLTLHGLTRGSAPLTRIGAGLTVMATISTWFTSGANDTLVAWLRPRGVTNGDLAVSVTAALLFAAGALAGRRVELPSWVTTGPGLALTSGWLLHAEITRDVRWSLSLALITGLLAVGLGGVRRRAAPLILGTVTIAIMIVVTAGSRLAELDSWVWLAGRGIALIGLAVLVERTVRADDAGPLDWQRLRQTWR